MRLLHLTLLAVETATIVRAVTISWTLHSSCSEVVIKNVNNPIVPDIYSPREDLAKSIIDSVKTAKKWAKDAVDKIDDPQTKPAVDALLGPDPETKKTVIANFKRLVKDLADEPTGAPEYWRSTAWANLRNSGSHWNNIIFTCSPPIDPEYRLSPTQTVHYDLVRQKSWGTGHPIMKKWMEQVDEKKTWDKLEEKNPGLTQKDTVTGDNAAANGKPIRDRRSIPQTINFHPLYIQKLHESNFAAWTQKDVDDVTHPDARKTFREMGEKKGVVIAPVDGLVERTFIKTVIHELFHIVHFGDMSDGSPEDSYGWYQMKTRNNPTRPDLYAMIAGVIALANQDGDKFIVDEVGQVTKL